MIAYWGKQHTVTGDLSAFCKSRIWHFALAGRRAVQPRFRNESTHHTFLALGTTAAVGIRPGQTMDDAFRPTAFWRGVVTC